MKKMLLGLVMFFGVLMTAAPAHAAPLAATYGGHRDLRGFYTVGYYCPIGYRLVYGPYTTVGYYWNGFAYVYGAYTSVGYYCAF